MFAYLFTHSPLFYLIQSLWRDEAFSILAAQRSLLFIVTKLGFEPPLYYSMLHGWIKIFGESELSTRGLSFLGFTLATIIVIKWADILFKKHWLSIFLPLTFFLNPMLLYYAFEVRTYGWYTFFSVATLFSYVNNKWPWFVASAVLGFYTHVYIGFLLMALGAHFFFTKIYKHKVSTQKFLRHPTTISFIAITLCALPWIIKILLLSKMLSNSWYFPVDLHLIRSVLGNIFIGYEGTPWYGWQYTRYLSLLLFGSFVMAYNNPKARAKVNIFLSVVWIPLLFVIGVSFFKPLFVNRYLIFVTIGEVFLLAFAIQALPKVWQQKLAALIVLIFLIWFNTWYPTKHAKLPIRPVMQEINQLMGANDLIYADDPIIYLETKYYGKNRARVFLYNPTNALFPWYIGDAVVTKEQMKSDLPIYPNKAFVVHKNGSYTIMYQSLLNN